MGVGKEVIIKSVVKTLPNQNGNEEANEYNDTILVETRGNTKGMHWESWVNYVVLRTKKA